MAAYGRLFHFRKHMDTNPETEVTGDAVAEAQLEALFSRGPQAEPQEDIDQPEAQATAEDEEAGDGQSESEETGEEWEDVDLDGEILKVTKPQAEKLKAALAERLMQRDYTQKTQAVAERQRALELQEQQVQIQSQAHAVLGQKHAELLAAAQQLQRYEQLNWAQLTAEEAYPLIVQRDQLRAEVWNKQAEIQNLAAEFKAKHDSTQQQWRAKLLEVGRARLNEELGGWNDEKGDQARRRMLELGFQPHELESNLVLDPCFIRAIYESAQYANLQKSKAETIQKKVSAAKPFTPPAARGIQKSQADSKAGELRDRMKKSGKSEDVEAFLAARFTRKK